MLSISALHLEGTHFQSSMSVTPISCDGINKYHVEMQITKMIDENSIPQLINSSELICIQGEPAHLIIESEDKADLLSIQIILPANTLQKSVEASILMKEKGQVVLSSVNVIKLNI